MSNNFTMQPTVVPASTNLELPRVDREAGVLPLARTAPSRGMGAFSSTPVPVTTPEYTPLPGVAVPPLVHAPVVYVPALGNSLSSMSTVATLGDMCNVGPIRMPGPASTPQIRRRVMPPTLPAPTAGSGGIDICFVMDCTSSMAPWIEAAKTTVKDMIAALPSDEPCRRVAFIAYRDFADGLPQVKAFTEDVDEVVRFIDSQDAEGGMDLPEDVAGGLASALALRWRSETRTIVLVGDAPCHGQKYHQCSDDYPEGDPTGLSMVNLMRSCRQSHIDFTFVQFTSETHKMQGMLKAVYESAAGPENIRKFELRDLREIIAEAGGEAAVARGPSTVSGSMLSAAVAPALASSVRTSRAGRTISSVAVATSMENAFRHSAPSRHVASTPATARVH